MNGYLLLLICIAVPIVLYLAWRLNEKEAEKLLRKLFEETEEKK
jgi:hypothetical protein